MSKLAERWIFLGGVVLLLCIAAVIALNVANVERLRAQAGWVERSNAVSAALEGVLAELADAETGQRGYLITGDERYLEPYNVASKEVPSAITRLAESVADNPQQQAALGELREAAEAKLAELAHTVQLRRERGFEAARDVVITDVGKAAMDRARGVVAAMEAREGSLLAERRAEAARAYLQARIAVIGGGLFAAALVAAYLLLLSRHIRAREHATLQLAQQHELLLTTLSSIGDGVITTDPAGRVTFVNTVAARLTGWSNSEARGLELTRVFHIVNEYTREPVENPALRALREGVIVGLANHTILISKDGTERSIDDSAAPIRVPDGPVFGCVLVFRDVTERARLDAEMRTADRRKDEFLATLAHELRNPLAPISNALFILAHAGSTPATVERARITMRRQVQQMVRLIDDLLDVGRIRLGKIVLARRRVALAEVVEQAVETVMPMVEAAHHRLEIVLPSEPVYLDADPIRIAQVFSNLLNNAAKFTPRGGSISLAAQAGHGEVVLRVSDNGIGIESRNLEEIFGLFSQVDQSIERPHGGLGIGLSLVRTLVELHGGSVVASSEGPGRGAQFTVRLPLAAVASSMPKEEASPAVPAKRRVLVVDDNVDGAESLGAVIQLLGHEVHVAYDAAAALKAGEQWGADLVFLDIGLPGMSGYDACRAMRATDWGRHAFIVALTGWGQEQDRKRASEAGFDAHVVKPIAEEELRRLCSLPRGSSPLQG